jgi:hypothetical protein
LRYVQLLQLTNFLVTRRDLPSLPRIRRWYVPSWPSVYHPWIRWTMPMKFLKPMLPPSTLNGSVPTGEKVLAFRCSFRSSSPSLG